MNQSITQNSQNEKKISNSMKRRKKAKININLVVYVLLFFFAGLVIILAWSQSSQSHMAVPLPLKFVGEYCQNNGEWKTLEENTRVSAYDGELKLCGRFNLELPEGAEMKCYLNHIGMVMYLNGERVLETSYEKYPDMCGSVWGMWELPLMSAGDEIEIRLKNPHCYGNADAYNEFLDSLYMSGSEVLKEFYEQEELPYRSFCVFILVVSVALIGTAAGYQLLGLPNRCLLLKLGVLSLLMGIYIYFDARDISMQSDSVVFNTYVRQISMMLAFCMLGAAAVELLKEKRKKMAEIIVYVLMAADFASMALSLAGKVRIYDTGFFFGGHTGNCRSRSGCPLHSGNEKSKKTGMVSADIRRAFVSGLACGALQCPFLLVEERNLPESRLWRALCLPSVLGRQTGIRELPGFHPGKASGEGAEREPDKPCHEPDSAALYL